MTVPEPMAPEEMTLEAKGPAGQALCLPVVCPTVLGSGCDVAIPIVTSLNDPRRSPANES